MKQFDFPVIVLAAGASRRMRGRDKLLENVDGMPLVRVQAIKARAATLAGVFVTLPQAPHARYEALLGLDLTTVPVPDAAEGLSASLRRGLDALPEDTARVMVLLADLPDITVQDMKIVAQAVEKDTDAQVWRGMTKGGKPGHPIVFDSAVFGALKNLTGDGGAKELLAGRDLCQVPLPGNRALADLDTPEDWATWRARRAQTSRS